MAARDLETIGHKAPRPARVTMAFGQPVRADALLAAAHGDRRLVMDAVGLAIADVIPARHRGAYEDPDRFPEAREVLIGVRRADADPAGP